MQKLSYLFKKLISITMVLILTFSFLSFEASASNDIKVLLNGTPIKFDVPPQIINGRTMVPIRAIFEAMGATVSWDDSTKTVYALKGNTFVEMSVGSNNVLINDSSQFMDCSPVIINNRTLAPARYVAESFDYTVDWDGATKTVKIYKDPFKTFYKVMRSYQETWKYDDSTTYYLNYMNRIANESTPQVDVSYDVKSDRIIFSMEYDTENYESIGVDLTLYPESDKVDVWLFLYPSAISGSGTVKKDSFNQNTVLDFDFSTTARTESLCNQITKDSAILTLKLAEEFLINSNTTLRLKDLGFESFDASTISVSQLKSKILASYDMFLKEDSSNTSSSSKSSSTPQNTDGYYVYKGSTVPEYSDISGDEYLGVDDEYYVYEYSREGLNDYLSFLDDLGFIEYNSGSGVDFYCYYNSEYIVYIAKTIIRTKHNANWPGKLIDVIEVTYKTRN